MKKVKNKKSAIWKNMKRVQHEESEYQKNAKYYCIEVYKWIMDRLLTWLVQVLKLIFKFA